jgi:cob(I)alamin adenosyltransferase
VATKIYTKTGDLGNTSLIGGTKIPKSHIRIESYGNIDELNSYIGLLSDYLQDEDLRSVLKEVQDRLFTIGSSLACDPDKETGMHIPDLTETDILFLEREIDRMNDALPIMKHFILPGGHVVISTIHITRCVCRRAERGVVNLLQNEQFVELLVIKYLNRLSDYLFVLARYVGKQLGVDEVIWMPRK